jgi:succinate dehydrogenase / fumarate reductase cytochrome b subunit
MAHARDPRPLAPHLQVWRWHVTMATSIFHRASGVALYGGAFILTVWLAAVAAGPDAYAIFEGLALSWFGRAALFAFTVAALYHLANGVRHLFWDLGRGLAPKASNLSGWFVILFSVAGAVGVWFAAYTL